jgi:hypothetical protein
MYEAEFLFKKPKVGAGVDVSQAALTAFGEFLMRYIRDPAIHDADSIITGQAKGLTAQQFKGGFDALTAEQRELLQRLVPVIVDGTLHHLLWCLEQVEWVKVRVETEGGVVDNLKDVSDGLEGEAYDWIPRFSEERYDKTFYDK